MRRNKWVPDGTFVALDLRFYMRLSVYRCVLWAPEVLHDFGLGAIRTLADVDRALDAKFPRLSRASDLPR